MRLLAFAGLVYLGSQLWLSRYSGGDGFVGYRTCLETLMWCAPLLVCTAAEGVKRVPAAVTWSLIGFSVAFFACAMFIPGEILGVHNPWTSWAPTELLSQYGLGRVLLGVFIGAASVFVVWGVLSKELRCRVPCGSRSRTRRQRRRSTWLICAAFPCR